MRYPLPVPPHPGSADDPHAGNRILHFFLLEQDSEVSLLDAGPSGYRDTLEPSTAAFDRRLRNRGLPIRQT
jgi:hypothetical protein